MAIGRGVGRRLEFAGHQQRLLQEDGFQVGAGSPTPSLAEIRRLLTGAYPPVGPIFA